MTMTRRERLEKIFEQLRMALRASSAEEALNQLSDIVNDIEDHYSGIPFDPISGGNDGRFYSPQEDNKRAVTGNSNVVRYRTKGHNIFIGSNGSIEIQRMDTTIEFSKLGSDDRDIWSQ